MTAFWWMNWRRGKLIVGKPRSYAARGSLTENLIITFPLVFFNDGAAAIVVQNLRLLLLDEGSNTRPLFFNATLERRGPCVRYTISSTWSRSRYRHLRISKIAGRPCFRTEALLH